VRQRLGAEAVVLGSREVVHRRFPWSTPRVETEVTAAAGIEPRHGSNAEQARELDERLRSPATIDIVTQPTHSFRATEGLSSSIDGEGPVTESEGHHDAAVEDTGLSDDVFRMFTRLIDAEVHEEHARNLLFEAQQTGVFVSRTGTSSATDALQSLVESQLRCSGGISLIAGQRRVVAVVGPTGVGKTTTIAKLAANYHLTENRRIGLITIDTFRVGGVDQLRTYAEVIGLPMRSASTSSELVAALDEFADCELVLIDSAGRSPRDEQRIQELRDLLSDASIDEIHLVLNLSSSHRSLMSLYDRFRVLRPTHLILSKLDEAGGLGAIYSAARGVNLPLSYFTTGQAVPDDIEPAKAVRAARWIVGLEDLFGSAEARPRRQESALRNEEETPY
jgi:flagellar biosynthesis protein FlhF